MTLQEQLDEILYDLEETAENVAWQEAKQDAKKAILELIDKEIIGEDKPFNLEKEKRWSEFDMAARSIESQNQLRQEQRNKLKGDN